MLWKGMRFNIEEDEKNINKFVFKFDFSFYCVILFW